MLRELVGKVILRILTCCAQSWARPVNRSVSLNLFY